MAVRWLLATLGMCWILSGQQIPTNGDQPATTVPRVMRVSSTFHPANDVPAAPVESVTFSVYREQTGGIPLWQETQNVNLDAEGHYTALMGSSSSDGLPLELFSSTESRWLGVLFNRPGETEQPRTRLASVPYALKASDAETLGGRPASAYLLNPIAAEWSAAGAASANPTSAVNLQSPGLVASTGPAVTEGDQSQRPIPIRYWPAPPTWQPTTPAERAAVRTGTKENPQITDPAGATQYAMLVAVTPCRLVDTRSNMPTPYGAGASYPTAVTWTAGSTHSIPVPSAPTGTYTGPGDPTLIPCSLPAAVAYSANITVVPSSGTVFSFLSVCPTGTSTSACSATAALSGYEGNSVFPGNIVGNSTVIPANGAGSFDVWVNSGTGVVIDINGYYVSPSSLSFGTGTAAAPSVTFAGDSTSGLYSSGPGTVNVATSGVNRLAVTSNGNVGIGTTSPVARLDVAGNINLSGNLLFQGYPLLQLSTLNSAGNIGIGPGALNPTTTGDGNLAFGNNSLLNNSGGNENVAIGSSALNLNTVGNDNTALGTYALQNNVGSLNTAVGAYALQKNSFQNNIAIGYKAGFNLANVNNSNIDIGNQGVSGDSGAIRIGTNATHTSFFAAGIRGVTLSNSPLPVMVDSNGQLGTGADALSALCAALGYSDTFYCKAALGIVKIAFVTAGSYNGSLGGIDGANAKCQAEATAAGLPGSYLAWLSSSTRNPAAGLAKAGPWYATDKSTLIAPNWATLQTGTLTNNITLNASGTAGGYIVWSNTNPDGTAVGTSPPGNSCLDWTDGTTSNFGGIGYVNPQQNGGNWSNAYTTGCQVAISLFCFQQ